MRKFDTRLALSVAGAFAALALMASSPGRAHGPDATLVTQIAQLRAEVARLQAQVTAMEQRAGLNSPDYRVGSPASRLIEIRNSHGAITLDRDGISIAADKIRINGKALTIGAIKSLDIKGGAIVIDGDSLDMNGAGDMQIKGKALSGN